MNDLIVRNRQDEILGEGVDEAEGHLVLAPAPIDRVERHVFERVVHPTHVPFEAETQTAEVGRRRDSREGGGFLCNRYRAGKQSVDQFVGALQKCDGVAIFVAALSVGLPFPGFAGIVEVEHGGDGVDAQAIDVEAIDPIERAGVKESDHLLAAES